MQKQRHSNHGKKITGKRINILGVPFDPITETVALNQIVETIRHNNKQEPLFIATPNPEILLEARRNQKFKEILNRTDLNIADGTGIIWASGYLDSIKNTKSATIKIIKGLSGLIKMAVAPKRMQNVIPQRVTGTDLMKAISQATNKDEGVFLLGATQEVAQKTKNTLEKKYGCKVVGTDSSKALEENDLLIREKINKSKAKILFVAFGAPKQEIWIARNLPYLKSVKVAMGVGGAFDFISGYVPRAPAFFRKRGLEWVFRLLKQPKRIIRIFNAVINFPFIVIFGSINNPEHY